jgi:hypothetical protein
MGRILTQQRNNAVLNVSQNTISDAAIVAWNGFAESNTESMLIGAWVRERVRSSSYPTFFQKAAYQVSGVGFNVDPTKRLYTSLNNADATTKNTSDGGIVPFISGLVGWRHVVIIVNKTSLIKAYINGALIKRAQLTFTGTANNQWNSSGAVQPLVAYGSSTIVSCNLVFASTNDANKVLATDEDIRLLYETGQVPKDVIFWPMDEGNGNGAGICKAYVNGVNVPALYGTVNNNSWTQDSPFARGGI